MSKISFYPGPSRVYSRLVNFFEDAYQENVLSINHRSPEFIAISRQAITLLKEKLEIPQDYWVFFTSSATECWEIIAQSLIDKGSQHIFNGAFGEKWFNYTEKLQTSSSPTQPYPFSLDEIIQADTIQPRLKGEQNILCLTQNETSNGTAVPIQCFQALKKLYPDKLIIVDATSSMAGIYLPFSEIDVLYASVQKCFGLPAGMGIMVCSPRAIMKAQKLNHRQHYNSLAFMIDKMQDWQTTYTPNVINIYLLMRVLEMVPPIREVEAQLTTRVKLYEEAIQELEAFGLHLLIQNKPLRSTTVVAISGTELAIQKIKEAAQQEGMILGNGYGSWKKNTFRIANFPAIEEVEVAQLLHFLKNKTPKILSKL